MARRIPKRKKLNLTKLRQAVKPKRVKPVKFPTFKFVLNKKLVGSYIRGAFGRFAGRRKG